MKEYLKRLPKEARDLIGLCSKIATSRNTHAYLVGGFVRDLLLGVDNFDLDITVESDTINFAADFAHRLNARLIPHKQFGTATVIVKENLKIDFATSRKEAYPRPAMLPQVSPAGLKEDLFRRDFTINAMAISIGQEDFGSLIDFFGSKDDLAAKRIRVLHERSFLDDPTRILRAIRFEQRYNFIIETKTLRLLREAVGTGMLNRVSPHRMRDELLPLLSEASIVDTISRAWQLTGFKFIHRGISISNKSYQVLRDIVKNVDWFKRCCNRKGPLDTWLIYFLWLTDHLSRLDIIKICEKFAFRKEEQKRIVSFKTVDSVFISNLNKSRLLPSEVFGLLSPLSYEVLIMLKSKYPQSNITKHIGDYLKRYDGIHLSVGGKDLQKLGLRPGPKYQKILRLALEEKLNGKAKTKREELRLLEKLAARYR